MSTLEEKLSQLPPEHRRRIEDRACDLERIEQIRRAHASARPNPAANPAWFHAENDIGVLLNEIDRLNGVTHSAYRLCDCAGACEGVGSHATRVLCQKNLPVRP
jgi:hypothetical protein